MNKKIKNVIIFIAIILVIALLIYSLIYNKEIITEQHTYGVKMYAIEKNDGWYHYFENTVVDNNPVNNIFDGCNLKYEKLDGYSILVYSDETSDIGHMPTDPLLTTSDKVKNRVSEREEVKMIKSFFDERQFNKKITINDLSDLKLTNFDYDDILELYNNVQVVPYENGYYAKYKINTCEILKEKVDTTTVQVGILNLATKINGIWIDLKYDNNTYLSDKITNKTATEEEITLYNLFKEIEKEIIESQDITSIKDKYMSDSVYYKSLLNVLNTLNTKDWD